MPIKEDNSIFVSLRRHLLADDNELLCDRSEVTLADFVNSMQLAEEENDPEAGEVKLINIHKSKGLEFDYVFIAGVNAGVLPFGFSQKTRSSRNSSEERRLMYVVMTRAKKQLIISFYGRHPSYFLSEIPEAQIRKMDLRAEADRSDAR